MQAGADSVWSNDMDTRNADAIITNMTSALESPQQSHTMHPHLRKPITEVYAPLEPTGVASEAAAAGAVLRGRVSALEGAPANCRLRDHQHETTLHAVSSRAPQPQMLLPSCRSSVRRFKLKGNPMFDVVASQRYSAYITGLPQRPGPVTKMQARITESATSRLLTRSSWLRETLPPAPFCCYLPR